MALNPIAMCCYQTKQAFLRVAWTSAMLALVVVFSPLYSWADTLMIDVVKAARLDQEQIVATLSKADVVLIGEHHNNPAHHLIQARLIETLIKAGRRPALIFEMLTERQERHYRLYRQNVHTDSASESVHEWDDVLEWTARGWPILPAYMPLFTLAGAHGLEVGHADLPADLVRNILRYGIAAIPKSLRDRLFETSSISDVLALSDRLAPVVTMVHGMKTGDPAMGGFIAAQLAKDAYMALRLAELSRPVVLIAGVDHIRMDIGVPVHLKKRGFTGSVLSIGMIGKDRKWLEAQSWDGAAPPFDWVWLDETE